MTLKQRLIEQITLDGPMNVADYMARCLLDPAEGYYTTRPAIGVDGDFITAPMVSQMFGDMIGVWVAETWRVLGAPEHFRLVEIGGGDGTLMHDILRIADQVPGLRTAAEIVMIEPSPPLQARQAARLPEAAFVASLDGLAVDKPVIVIANEVLDCLPARQFVQTETGWCERCIGVADGRLVFGLVPAPADFAPPAYAEPGEIVEISPAQVRFAQNLALTVKAAGGTALLIDYGRDQPGCGDTLQALHRHQKTDPLEASGEHDLTVWADFPAVTQAARSTGVRMPPAMTQAAFLRALGIEARHAALLARHPEQSDVLQRQYARLTAPDQMGELFKVMAMAWPPTLVLPALDTPGATD